MRDEVFSSVGAQDMDTSGYKMSDLDVVYFYWENDWLDVDAVCILGIDTPLGIDVDGLEMRGAAENPILLDEEEDKEKSPPPPTTPVTERPTRPTALLRNCPFGRQTVKLPLYV